MIDYITLAFTSGAVTFSYWMSIALVINAILYRGVLWLKEASKDDVEWFMIYVFLISISTILNILAIGGMLKKFSNFISCL